MSIVYQIDYFKRHKLSIKLMTFNKLGSILSKKTKNLDQLHFVLNKNGHIN